MLVTLEILTYTKGHREWERLAVLDCQRFRLYSTVRDVTGTQMGELLQCCNVFAFTLIMLLIVVRAQLILQCERLCCIIYLCQMLSLMQVHDNSLHQYMFTDGVFVHFLLPYITDYFVLFYLSQQ